MKVEINGEMHELEYTVNSVCDLEETTGKELADFLMMGGYKAVRALLWCGLIEKNPKMTMKTAGELMQAYITEHSLEALIAKVGEAIKQAGFLRAGA